jgi:signal transduction histidine kinase
MHKMTRFSPSSLFRNLTSASGEKTSANSNFGSNFGANSDSNLKFGSKFVPWKVVFVVLLTSVSVIAVVLWKTQDLLLEDKLGFVTDSLAKQSAPLRRLVQARLQQERTDLLRFASEHVVAGSTRVRSIGEYEVIALMQAGEKGQWNPLWIEKEANVSPRWEDGLDRESLANLPYSKVRDGEVLWTRLEDDKGVPLEAVFFSVRLTPDASKKAILVGLGPVGALAAVTDDYIGAISTAFVIDDRGYVAGHPDKRQLGMLALNEPIVKEIVHGQKTFSTGQYGEVNKDAVIGHFEHIDHSNLFVVVTTPVEAAREILDRHLRTSLAAASSVIILGLLLAWFVGRSILRKFAELGLSELDQRPPGFTIPAQALQTQQSNHEFVPNLTLVEGADGTLRSRLDFNWDSFNSGSGYQNSGPVLALGEGLAQTVREPLLAILGHARLIKSKAGEGEIWSHADNIERDTRRTKDVIERLRGFELETPKIILDQTMNLGNSVERILTQLEPSLTLEDIQLVRNIKDSPEITGSVPNLERMLKELIENSREALKGRSIRRIEVELNIHHQQAWLTVSDTGIGMSRDLCAHAFEPFFKEFESPERYGLGLSFVQLAIKCFQGKCAIQSIPGEGTSVTLQFPLVQKPTNEIVENAIEQNDFGFDDDPDSFVNVAFEELPMMFQTPGQIMQSEPAVSAAHAGLNLHDEKSQGGAIGVIDKSKKFKVNIRSPRPGL